MSCAPSAIRLRASATERLEPSTSSANLAAMALMDSMSSEALARRASGSMPVEMVKSLPLRRLDGLSLVGGK